MIRTTNGFLAMQDNDLLAKADYIYTQIGLNVATFATPKPALPVFFDGIKDFRLAIVAAAGRSLQAIGERKEQKLNLVKLMKSLGNYVTEVANGDVNIINKAGFDATKPPAPVAPLVTPLAPIIKLGTNAGSLVVKIKSQKGTRTNQYLISEDAQAPVAAWKHAFDTKSKFEFTELKSATRYYVRVCQIGKGQQNVLSPAANFVTQ